MNWPFFIQLVVTAIVAFLSAFFAHKLSSKRDRANKKRDQRINYLIDAYRRLESVSNRPGTQDIKPAESAIADIQLFGSPKQVILTNRFATDFVKNKTASLNPLLEEFRRDLRKELEALPGKLIFLRWNVNENNGI